MGGVIPTNTRKRRARHSREEPGRKPRPVSQPSLTGARTGAWRAVEHGARLTVAGSMVRTRLDLAQDCARPFERRRMATSRDQMATPRERSGPLSGISVEIATPCRRCSACLEHRRRLWSARARSETASAPETFFGTLTFRSELQHYWLTKCREDAHADGVDFDQLSLGTQWGRRVAYAGKEARKYIARLRQVLPAPMLGKVRLPNFRYLLVAERHKQGTDDTRPHFHMLAHTIHAGWPVPLTDHVLGNGRTLANYPSILNQHWDACGFAQWRTVTEDNCTYLCKYLAKDPENRVRASEQYGAFDYAQVAGLPLAVVGSIHASMGIVKGIGPLNEKAGPAIEDTLGGEPHVAVGGEHPPLRTDDGN